MKMRLKSRNRIPYGGVFAVKDPLSGLPLSANHFDLLLERVTKSRKANGIPVGLGLAEEVERWCCEAHPDECQDVDEAMPRRKRLTLDDVIRGAKVLLSFKLSGSPLVEPQVAEQRAATCSRCPMNTGYSRPCSVCTELRNLVQSIAGGRRTSVDEQLHVCNICGCDLKAAVWLELADQCKGVSEEMRQPFAYAHENWNCWKVCP